jgi:hypothetical protein
VLYLTINQRGFDFFIFIFVSCSTCTIITATLISFHVQKKEKKNRINLQLLCYSQAKSNPIARRPRPSRRSRALKHSLGERSLTHELLSSPFVLVVCPPPCRNSLVHLAKTTHPNHNGHPSHPRPRRQTHRPSDGNGNGLLGSYSAHSLSHGLTQCFGCWVPCGQACW